MVEKVKQNIINVGKWFFVTAVILCQDCTVHIMNVHETALFETTPTLIPDMPLRNFCAKPCDK